MADVFINIPDYGGLQDLLSDSAALVITGDRVKTVTIDTSSLIASSAASVVNTYTAGETISANQTLYELDGAVFKGDHDTLQRANIIGVALTAATIGQPVKVLQYGILEDGAFNWAPTDLIFVADNGVLTSVAPDTGYLTRIGKAITTTQILVSIDSPITL